ncbi:DUF1552 domain-containing protein [Pelagicoccus mobilis]|uniref:DUF1552 domain-containing protein n=1 Tax=Pelagicoccus mobilis TaxID=415221 RepID=A0A934VTZ6_9BACT|nr:DUF1552 domain-containing protein [Pelagicoccus mobilis]MBK1880024.1 DUF1552 domain-containing protein [Pelagicoccus mobilis]
MSKKSKNSFSRRSFLRSTSSLIALPFLESLAFRPFASAASSLSAAAAAPKRMVFLGMGFGVTAESWYPDIKTPGRDYVMPKVLKSLTKFKDEITLIQNLEHANSKDGHSGSTFWLTGANRYAVPGKSFHNTISVDQVAANEWGKHTRFTSIQLDTKSAKSGGHGPGLSLAWNKQGKPIPGYNTPVAVYHRLFSNDTTSLAERQHQLSEQRSVLDTVLSDAKSINRKLSREDADKLDDYFQSVREIEIRLSKEEDWLGIEKKKPSQPLKEPKESLQGVHEVRMMYDLMIAAMQVDATRVFTYRMPGDSMLSSLGIAMSAHNMSHYGPGDRYDASEARDRAHAKLLAEFITKLKATKEEDGSSLYDNVSIAFGSNLSKQHNLKNCPTLLTGGGAGISHGRHIVANHETPLCNVWLSLLNGSGIKADSFGDSTEPMQELFRS